MRFERSQPYKTYTQRNLGTKISEPRAAMLSGLFREDRDWVSPQEGGSRKQTDGVGQSEFRYLQSGGRFDSPKPYAVVYSELLGSRIPRE
jgi:hypothetical protein